MTNSDRSVVPLRTLRFDHYVLDLASGCLSADGSELVLRPKTFAVLRHLVERPGRLVSKEELFSAVWPGVTVTDDSLVQCIKELRRALKDDGQRLIKTVPRRGYRFEMAVSSEASSSRSANVSATTGIAEEVPMAAVTDRHQGRAWRYLPTPSAPVLGVLCAVVVSVGIAWFVSDYFKAGIGANQAPQGDATQASSRIERTARPRIAVLPFSNQSAHPEEDYFSDGMTEDIINALGRFPSLTVLSWNAVFPFKGKPARPEDVGRSLTVRYLVEGSVRRSSERVRVTTQLTDTSAGQVIWSGRFDDALHDLFTLQDKITSEIVLNLAVQVTEVERRKALAKQRVSLDAYDYVLRARFARRHPTRESNVEARALLSRAIEIDPSYAAAHVALGENIGTAIALGWVESPTDALQRVEALAAKALDLDRTEVRAHILLAQVHSYYRRFDRAQEELERAHALNPNDAGMLAGRGRIMVWLGQIDTAIDALEAARNVDPDMSYDDRFVLGLAYFLKERYSEAVVLLERNVREVPSDYNSQVLLAAAYAQHNRLDAAQRAADAVRRVLPQFNAATYGTRLQIPAHRERLREGLLKAGLSSPQAANVRP